MANCRNCTWGGTRTAHCAECHRTFSTPANFDTHRAGKNGPDGRRAGECYDPADSGLVVNSRGYWAQPAADWRDV